eukprot:jgi/Botrbrau1/680/Bobra.160_2s0004.2
MELSCRWQQSLREVKLQNSTSHSGAHPALKSINPLRVQRVRVRQGTFGCKVVAMNLQGINLKQRWKGLQSTTADKWNEFGIMVAATPPGQAYQALTRFLHNLFAPVVRLWGWAVYVTLSWYNYQAEWYNYFIREESKRKWSWTVEYRQELDFYASCVEGARCADL